MTALCYGSISVIGNRVTDVTCERTAGTRPRQQGEKCSKISADIVAVILRMVSIAKMCC